MAKHHSWQLATVRRVGTHKALARSLLSGSPDQCTRLGLELHRLSCSWKNVVLDVPTFANKRRNLGSTSSVTFESSIASMSTSASTTAKIAGISIKNKGTPSRKTKRKLGRKPNFNPILLEEPWGSLVAHAKRIHLGQETQLPDREHISPAIWFLVSHPLALSTWNIPEPRRFGRTYDIEHQEHHRPRFPTRTR